MFVDPNWPSLNGYAGVVINHEGKISHVVIANADAETQATFKDSYPEPITHNNARLAIIPIEDSLLPEPDGVTLPNFLARWLSIDPNAAENLKRNTRKMQSIDADDIDRLEKITAAISSNVSKASESDFFTSLPPDLLDELIHYEKQLRAVSSPAKGHEKDKGHTP
jgi:hypothetical protein